MAAWNVRYTGRALSGARAHWPLLAVVAAFLASMLVVPVLAPVTISDDWVYVRSVEILMTEQRLYVLSIATAHLVFQILWAGMFAVLFGPSLGVIRLSVVVLWLLGGVACYGLLWELSRQRALAALGCAVFLFNPLGYALAFSFMTDAPFTALLAISSYATMRGLRGERAERWMLAGAVVASLGVLIRQPGLLIPLGVLSGLLVGGRLRLDRASVRLSAIIAVPPFLTYALYYVWLTRVNGVPVTQIWMRDALLEGGLEGLGTHALQMFIIDATYLGAFLLPVVAAALPAASALAMTFRGWQWAAFGGWALAVVAGFAAFWETRHVMPYVPHFFSKAGLGPNDLVVGRWPIAGDQVWVALTFASTISAVVVGLLVVGALRRARPEREQGTMLLAMLVWQGVGTLIVSTYFRHWSLGGISAPSLDRYLLPLLPLGLALAVWALGTVRPAVWVGWLVAVGFAAFAVAGTRDNLVYHTAIWEMAREAEAEGVPLLQLDAGAAWDGYILGDYSYSLPEAERVGAGHPRWWISLFAPGLNPKYSIASWHVTGHTTLRSVRYGLWLDPTAELFLVRQDPPPR